MDMFDTMQSGFLTRLIAIQAANVLLGVPSTAAAGAAAASAAENVFNTLMQVEIQAKKVQLLAEQVSKKAAMLKTCDETAKFLEKVVKLK